MNERPGEGQELLRNAVDWARAEERSIVWTWAMRGTLHLVPAEDVRWLVELLGPVFIRSGTRRRAELGLDHETGERAVAALRRLLAETGPIVRAEIAERLGRQGIPVAGQAIAHLVALAALRGVICRGPDIGREPGYVLLDDWIQPARPVEPEIALAELARRYLRAFGPATPADFVTWSGLGPAQARNAWQAIAGEISEVEAEGGSLWEIAPHPLPPSPHPLASTWSGGGEFHSSLFALHSSIRLLPRFDTFLLGYRSRDFVLDARWGSRINAGGGIIRPAVLADGEVVGTWRTERQGKRIRVVIEPFDEIGDQWRPALEAEVADLSEFLGTPASLA